MTIKEYQKKRDFKKTSEPKGGVKISSKNITKSKGKIFVVQKHYASHLHYDFRLEMKGTLKSWAVPKGPSLDPSQKRLAVEVEDHPLEYAKFEGTIPKGQYGAGKVIIWDKGYWISPSNPLKEYQDGDITIFLLGKKLKGEWKLIRMKARNDKYKDKDKESKNWLLFKVNDEYAKKPRVRKEPI